MVGSLIRHLPLVLLSAALGLAALGKLVDPAAFQADILAYRLLDYPWAGLVALWLPWWELLLALALLAPPWRRTALAQSLLLLGAFCLLLGLTMWRGIETDCGCFGALLGSSMSIALIRNALLISCGLIAWRITGQAAGQTQA